MIKEFKCVHCEKWFPNRIIQNQKENNILRWMCCLWKGTNRRMKKIWTDKIRRKNE